MEPLPALYRPEFPTLARATYLNTCAQGLLGDRVARAAHDFLDLWRTDPDWNRFLEVVEGARRAFARLVGAREDEIAVQANASTGVASVLSALPAQPGRSTVVTSDLDFPTTPFIAEQQTRRGLRHEHLRTSPHALAAETLDAALGWDTALVALPLVGSFTGVRLDLDNLVETAHDKGAPVLVDAFQALGTTPVDVKRLDCDFLVSGVYKWLLGNAGLAFLYVRRDWHQRLLPTALGWYAARDPYAFEPSAPLAPDARRFQYGGPSLIGAAMARAGIEMVEEVGVASIEEHNQALGDRILDGVAERGWSALTPRDRAHRGSIVNFRVPDLPRALAALAAERVVVNERLGGIRVSPHFYNTRDDVDRMFAVLDKAR